MEQSDREWPCNGLIAHRKFGAPTASRWRWVGRAHITPQLKVTQPSSALNHWPPTVVLPNQRAVTARRASARGQATQLTFPSYLAHALCANKLFHKQGVFGHRAILIFPGIETWLGVLGRTQHPVLHVSRRTCCYLKCKEV